MLTKEVAVGRQLREWTPKLQRWEDNSASLFGDEVESLTKVGKRGDITKVKCSLRSFIQKWSIYNTHSLPPWKQVSCVFKALFSFRLSIPSPSQFLIMVHLNILLIFEMVQLILIYRHSKYGSLEWIQYLKYILTNTLQNKITREWNQHLLNSYYVPSPLAIVNMHNLTQDSVVKT